MTKTSTRWRIASGIAALTLAVTAMAGASAMAWADDQAADDQAGQAMAEPQEALEASETVTGIPTEASDGWGKDSGNWYFALAGTKAVGLTYIDGSRYYFDSKGVMQTGWQKYSYYSDGAYAQWYYFLSSGKGANGWLKVSGSWYYFVDGYTMTRGSLYIDGTLYLFLNGGQMATGSGWKSVTSLYSGETYWYYMINGKLVSSTWKQIGGKWYYFNVYGEMATGNYEIYNSSSQSYVTYLFNSDGTLASNCWVKDGSDSIRWYYANANGTAFTGWKKIGSYYYYFDDDGMMVSDDNEYIGTKVYYFDASGHMANSGWFEYDEDDYYAYSDGHLATGFCKIDGGLYDFSTWGVCWDEEGDPSYASYTWETVSGKYKLKLNYADGDGYWYYYDGTIRINGILYYFDDDGYLVDTVGWVHDTDVDDYYYVTSTKGYLAQNCWEKVNGSYYYFDKYGAMLYSDYEYINGEKYQFAASGKMVTGWYKRVWSDDSISWYYYLSSGKAAHGWLKISGTWYYFDYNGEMVTNDTAYWTDDSAYLLGADGKIITGNGWKSVINEYGEKTYYYLESGKCATGWKKLNGYWYYLCPTMACDGPEYVYTSGFEDIYGFDASGRLKTGWYENSDGDWYWFNSNGKAVSGFKQISGKWYCFSYEGRMCTDETVAGIYLDENGHPQAADE